MLQIKNLSITHKKDLRVILNDFSCVLNDGDKAVIIGEEGNGKSTLLKWIYDEKRWGRWRQNFMSRQISFTGSSPWKHCRVERKSRRR